MVAKTFGCVSRYRALMALVFGLLVQTSVLAQGFSERRAEWLAKAEACKPRLIEDIVYPQAAVTPVADTTAFQHWRFDHRGPMTDVLGHSIKRLGTTIVDFGDHYTGYFTFRTKGIEGAQDAPVRLRLTFAELPAELMTPLDPWKGSLSRAWMQEETLTLMQTGDVITLPRRMAMRYLKVELLGASVSFDFCIDSMSFRAVSAGGESRFKLRADCPEMVRRIHDVGLRTLHECMQTVYEDGPKRDRRLWVGDLYLEMLAGRYSYKNDQLTRRCLYLFAGTTTDEGIVMSNLFETPQPHAQTISYMLTYAMLFNSTLLEYLEDTGDMETARELWPVARRQIEDALTYVDEKGLFSREMRPWPWLFFDWREGLDVSALIQAATIFGIIQTQALAHKLGLDEEVKAWTPIKKRMIQTARRNMWDKDRGIVVSGSDNQVSVLGQAWMIRAGVLSAKEGAAALRTVLAMPTAVRPGTPYGMHYLIDAMMACGMHREARETMIAYWGDMVHKGADTFWEAYDATDDFISPYRFFPVNSACHAWSCTPIYFIHKYPDIFQTPADVE